MKTYVKNYTLHVQRVAVEEQQVGCGQKITCPEVVAALARGLIGQEAQECFIVFALDVQNRVQGYSEVARGSIDSCGVDIRQVFRVPLILGASSIVVSHNHPSGDPTPSGEDLRLTTRIKEAGRLIGLPLIDHVIVSDTGFVGGLVQQGVQDASSHWSESIVKDSSSPYVY